MRGGKRDWCDPTKGKIPERSPGRRRDKGSGRHEKRGRED